MDSPYYIKEYHLLQLYFQGFVFQLHCFTTRFLEHRNSQQHSDRVEENIYIKKIHLFIYYLWWWLPSHECYLWQFDCQSFYGFIETYMLQFMQEVHSLKWWQGLATEIILNLCRVLEVCRFGDSLFKNQWGRRNEENTTFGGHIKCPETPENKETTVLEFLFV